jgi:hypothetical protein
MMVWTCRKLIGHFHRHWGGFGSEVGQMKAAMISDNIPATNPTQHTTSRQDEAITTTNHHHMNVLKDDGMDLQEIDW